MMSSADTLNFGPQWLRDLSEGSGTSTNSPTTSQIASTSKFKLAENRYGREELLALFVEDPEIPEELHREPSVVSEIAQVPLAFIPEHSETPLSSSFRGRGGPPSGVRGRSTPGRGRGRGRGTAWADHDDGPMRRPPVLRRAESEDWRGDAFRGKGDGAEDMGGLKEWRASGQKHDFWKDAWRDRSGDVGEQRAPRGRSMSSKDAEDSDRRWRDDEMNNITGSSKRDDSVGETPDGTKESNDEDGSPEKTEQQLKDIGPQSAQNGDVLNPQQTSPASPNFFPNFQKPKNELEPLSEVREVHETGQGENPPNQSSMRQEISHQQKSESVTDDVFQKFPHNDSGGGEKNVSSSPLFQEVPESEISTSLDGTASQKLPFSTSSPLGDNPAAANSPIAQLKALASTWFYKDPQGDVQGPFSSTQMMEWFNAGYFVMVLLVKRACDPEFVPLGELIKRWGQVPFSSNPKNMIPQVPPFNGNMTALMQHKYAEQQKMQFLRQQQQQQQQQQQATLSRPYQHPPDMNTILAKLLKNPDFCQLSNEQQQIVVLQYAAELKRQSESANMSFQSAVASDSLNLAGNHPNETSQPQPDLSYHQNMMEEARKKEEEEIKRIKKQQEEQKEFLRKQEEEFRKKEEMLMREKEQIKQLQLEAQRKNQELQRKIEEDEKLKQMQEMQERERRMKMEEEEMRKKEIQMRELEERRISEEEERRRHEEERRRFEMEEARRLEEERVNELRRLEVEREEQRMREEKRKQEEREKETVKEAEMQRKAEIARIRREKEAEAKAFLKKQQQKRQMLQVELPPSARWGDNQQTTQANNDSLSLAEILRLEKHQEQVMQQEEARIARETRKQPPKQKTSWGTASQEISGVSLLDIQREEAKQMSSTKQAPKPEKLPSLGLNTSWNKPPRIQPDAPKPAKSQTSFWDQVVEETPQRTAPMHQKQPKPQQPKQTKQHKGAKKTKSDEGQQVKALFQQQITKDGFTDWCEGYLRQMNAGSIDIPTFVNFLRDVESPYEVQEYVQSYLGESQEAMDFATLFLEQRAKLGGIQYKSPQNKAPDKPRSATARDTDGFEVVTANSKRGKKKLRKLQKVDPSILGFSVNAASDRVNMGEIQSADD